VQAVKTLSPNGNIDVANGKSLLKCSQRHSADLRSKRVREYGEASSSIARRARPPIASTRDEREDTRGIAAGVAPAPPVPIGSGED
jgi:hypothetical protein